MKLYHFLLGFRVEKGCDHTHTSFAKPSGAFYIPGSEHERFMARYTDALAHGDDLHITERHRHIGPLVVDLDFRHEPTSEELASGSPRRRYTAESIAEVVRIYGQLIAEHVQTQGSYDFYVLEKSGPTMQKGLIKDGVHLIAPGIVTRPEVQHLIRKSALPLIAEALKGAELANRIDDVVDEAVIERNNWLMYGSKKPMGEAYVVTRHLSYDRATAKVAPRALDEAATPADYVALFSIRNKHDECKVHPERAAVVQDFVAQQEEKRKRREAVQAVVGSSPNVRHNTCDNLDQVAQLVDLLDVARTECYNDWVRVGWCLRNIDHRLLEKWVDFSKRSPKYVEGECPRLWQYMRQGGLGIGTLHMWARLDSPERYRELLRLDLSELVLRSISGTHHDVARVVHHMYRYEYVCSSIRNHSWYEFRDHRWRESDSAYTLRRRMSTDVFKEYSVMAMQMQSRAIASADEGEQARLVETCQKLNGIALQLKKTHFKDNIIKECEELFMVEKFEELLDSDCDLIGFENGVYDLQRHEFREGRPDDHISFSTGINCVPYVADHPIVKDIKRFWEQIHPQADIRTYVLRTLSACLSGHILSERFNIWTGSGCHAPGTQIMMLDGSCKKVEDVAVGDRLMGDDNTPREVLQLFRGRADMWRIVPTKGEPFTVNGDHVLSLMMTNVTSVFFRKNRPNLPWMARWMERDDKTVVCTKAKCFATEAEAHAHAEAQAETNKDYVKNGAIIDLTVKSYLDNLRYIGERNAFLYRPAFVDFAAKELPEALDPYVLGVWLGDGTQRSSQITSMDEPVMEKVRGLLPSTVQMNVGVHTKGEAETYNISKAASVGGRKTVKNDIVIALDRYGLREGKHIPLDYRCNTREVRMQVLAGLLDTDGHYQAHTNQFELTLKEERFMDDTIALVRSLGLACYKKAVQKTCCNNGKVGTYYKVQIVGAGIEDIPTVLERKRARPRVKAKDVRRVGFKVERVEDGDFFGFELDGNHRYLMGDYVVQHNSNGKSLSVTLMEKAFGDYCCKFPVTLLTQKRAASNAASSEIARAKGRRFSVLQEPSEDERLNIGLMKELSGGDKIQCRELYKAPVEWRPQFKLFLLCNHLPSVPSDDGGTWRRIRVVEFGSKFVDKPTRENEFPIDPELTQKLDGWKEHFMAMLIDYHRRYAFTKVEEPEAVVACTRDYQRNNDHMADFVDTCVEKAADPAAFVSIDDLFAEFKDWVKHDHIPVKPPKKRDVQNYLDRYLSRNVKVNGRLGYRGYALRDRFGGAGGGVEDALA